MVVEAYSRNGGLMCPVDANATDTPSVVDNSDDLTPPPAGDDNDTTSPIISDDCSICDGKVTQMTMQYNGSETALVTVSQKTEGEVFNALVQPGGQFTVVGIDDKDTLGVEVTITVDGIEHVQIHTSCSVEIGPGYIAGDFEVTEAYSRNGGLMCPVN